MIEPLQKNLTGWIDDDGVYFELAICLGLLGEDVQFGGRGKSIVLGDPLLTPVLSQIVEVLHRAQILERNEDRQYRWNPRLVFTDGTYFSF